MHDGDSATGLLVRNERGDQWIEYGGLILLRLYGLANVPLGDKQFMEPQASVNRARWYVSLSDTYNC